MQPQTQQQKQKEQGIPPYSYTEAGYNPFFERDPRTYNASPKINSQNSPFIMSIVDNAIIYDPFTDMASQNNNPATQTTSGSAIQGGVLQSDNGNLQIDLTNGTINYSDGITNLLNLGGANAQGTPNSLTVQNSAGSTILSS